MLVLLVGRLVSSVTREVIRGVRGGEKAAPINGAFFCLDVRQTISVWGSVLPQTGWASPLILNVHF